MSTTQQSFEGIRRIRYQGDKIFVAVCWGLWCISFGFSFLHGSLAEWACCATLLALAATLFVFLWPATVFSRVGIGVILMSFAALMIDQAHGVVETHFAVFVLLSFLLFYRDWRPIGAAAGAICVQHLAFCWLQMRGFPVHIFPPGHQMYMIFVHAGYVVFEAAVLIYLTLIIRREALESVAIAQFGEHIARTGAIDLSFDTQRFRGSAGRGLAGLLSTVAAFLRKVSSMIAGIARASNDLSSASHRLFANSEEQARTAAGVFAALESMASASGTLKRDSAAVYEVLRESAEVVATKSRTMEDTATLMHTVTSTTEATTREIEHLRSESERIGNIVGLMKEVASQSGLLALNASIEAARAGERGKGFGVVAQEMCMLATRAEESLAEVESVVAAIGVGVARLHAHVEHSTRIIAGGVQQVRVASVALADVASHLPEVAGRADNMTQLADQHARVTSEVLSGIRQIDRAIKRNTSETGSFASLSSSLASMSVELATSVQSFHHQGG